MRFQILVLILFLSLVVPVLALSAISDDRGKDCPAFDVPDLWIETGHSPDGSSRTYATHRNAEMAVSVLVRHFKAYQETPMARAIQELKDLTLRGVGIVERPHPVKVGAEMWVALEWEKVLFDAAQGQTVTRGQQYYAKSPTGAVLLEVTFIGKKAAFEAFGVRGVTGFLQTCVWSSCEPMPPAEVALADAGELQKMGRQYFEAGQFDRAVEVYEKALARAGTNEDRAEIYYLMSTAYLGKKDPVFYPQALALAEKCLAISPRHWRAIMNKARIAMNTGDLEKADALFTEAEAYVEEETPDAKDLITQHSALTSVLKMRALKKREVETRK